MQHHNKTSLSSTTASGGAAAIWAPWRGPCRLAGFSVRGIPMFAVIDHGQVEQERAGLVDARRLVAMVHAG
jgi:hypothetical protein